MYVTSATMKKGVDVCNTSVILDRVLMQDKCSSRRRMIASNFGRCLLLYAMGPKMDGTVLRLLPRLRLRPHLLSQIHFDG